MSHLSRYQLHCVACGLLFPARNANALYCGATCRQRTWRRRKAANALVLARPTSSMEMRVWHGTPIQRRSDGWVNASAMCKANGKHLPHYMTNDRTTQYLQALSGSVGIPTDLLTKTTMTGPNEHRGTWVHPRLAVDLARWISPAFAVWMDGWFLESLQRPAPQIPPNAYMLNPGITIRAKSMEDARIIWYDAVWRAMVRGGTADLFSYAES
jgi:hypothetical protein